MTERYSGPLGEFAISRTDDEHASAIAKGELSAGPYMIEAIQEVKRCFPGAKAVRMGRPEKRGEEKCAVKDTSETTINPRSEQALEEDPTTAAQRQPKKSAKAFNLERHGDLFGERPNSRISAQRGTR
jgi:hypothetical protein